MDKLFIPAISGNNQEDTQTTATETAGMTQQHEFRTNKKTLYF
ncbi:hypothetical protein [Arsenophonus sp. PmNCSU2021_1]